MERNAETSFSRMIPTSLFRDYVRTAHLGILVMFETKNMEALDIAGVNQTATYLGDRIGRLGIIVTRNKPIDTIQRKIFSIWNDSAPRKIILTIDDGQMYELLGIRSRGESTTKWMQKHYRAFRTSVQ